MSQWVYGLNGLNNSTEYGKRYAFANQILENKNIGLLDLETLQKISSQKEINGTDKNSVFLIPGEIDIIRKDRVYSLKNTIKNITEEYQSQLLIINGEKIITFYHPDMDRGSSEGFFQGRDLVLRRSISWEDKYRATLELIAMKEILQYSSDWKLKGITPRYLN